MYRSLSNILILTILLLSLLAIRPQAQRPPVLAFYYAWFDDNTWTSGKTVDTPLTPYHSTDLAAIERHVQQAQGAGINALVQSWYGPQVENNQTESNFAALLDISARYNFKAAVDFEVVSPFYGNLGAVQNGLAALINGHIHHPAYFRFNGKPVIFFWKQEIYSVQQWANIRAAVDPNRTTYWIAEGVDVAYLEVFDGHHLYNISWAGNVYQEMNKWPPRVQSMENQTGLDKLWVATAMPGFNELHLNRANDNYRGRQDGAFYRESWDAAVTSQPDMIVITSFNEYLEGSHIEPSVAYGDFYLNLTRELIASLGNAPAPPPPPPTPTLSPAVSTASPSTALPILSPITDSLTYTIQAGDTLYDIALRSGTSLDDLMTANPTVDPTRLQIGQMVYLGVGFDALIKNMTDNPTLDPVDPDPDQLADPSPDLPEPGRYASYRLE